MLSDLQKRLKDKQVYIEVSEKAKEYIVEEGYDANYGARPLRRFIQRKAETLIAKKLIADDISAGTILKLDFDGEKLFIE